MPRWSNLSKVTKNRVQNEKKYYLCSVMPNTFFRFKQFVVYQDRCAMKVGTDGVLIGAWASGGRKILDIGAGTGLISIMMAQRFPEAIVDAVEIDEQACEQARENVFLSPFNKRVLVHHTSIQSFVESHVNERYDAIVSNPPYFENALKNPDSQRMLARHSDTLPFTDLFCAVARLLDDHGVFSAIIPSESKSRFDEEACMNGLFAIKEAAIKTTPRKPVKRILIAYSKHPATVFERTEEVLEISHGVRSEWYARLTRDFYL